MRTANKFYTSPNSVICRIANISSITRILSDRQYPYFIIHMNSGKENVICIPGKTIKNELEQLKVERKNLIKLVNR